MIIKYNIRLKISFYFNVQLKFLYDLMGIVVHSNPLAALKHLFSRNCICVHKLIYAY